MKKLIDLILFSKGILKPVVYIFAGGFLNSFIHHYKANTGFYLIGFLLILLGIGSFIYSFLKQKKELKKKNND